MINIMIDIMVLLIMIILMVTIFKIMMIIVNMIMEDFSNINLFSGQYSLKQLCVVCARCHLQDDDLDHNFDNQ